MARSTQWTTGCSVSREVLLEIVTSVEYEVERAAGEPGTVSAEVRNIRRTDDRLYYEIHTEDYARTMTGAMERNKRTPTVTQVDWDLKAFRATWRYHGHGGDRAEITGSTEVVGRGERAADLISVYNVKVHIPFIGGQAEKVVIRELEGGRGRFQDIVQRYCAARRQP
jgi:hypothetical protein